MSLSGLVHVAPTAIALDVLYTAMQQVVIMVRIIQLVDMVANRLSIARIIWQYLLVLHL
jgi:hypothetical protein